MKNKNVERKRAFNKKWKRLFSGCEAFLREHPGARIHVTNEQWGFRVTIVPVGEELNQLWRDIGVEDDE